MKFKIFKFKKVKSTNNTAIRIIQNTKCKYGMIISDSQINGRGQYGRKWISYKGNLFVSFFQELNKIKFSISNTVVGITITAPINTSVKTPIFILNTVYPS